MTAGLAKTLFEDTEAYTKAVYSVEFSPDGKLLATGSFDNTIRLWDMDKWMAIGPPVEEHIREVAASLSLGMGSNLYQGVVKELYGLWDVCRQNLIATLRMVLC